MVEHQVILQWAICRLCTQFVIISQNIYIHEHVCWVNSEKNIFRFSKRNIFLGFEKKISYYNFISTNISRYLLFDMFDIINFSVQA